MEYYLMSECTVYGPYTLPEMKSLPLLADTPVHMSLWPSDKWVYASDLPELRDCLSSLPGSSSPQVTTSAATNVIQIIQPQPANNPPATISLSNTSNYTAPAPDPKPEVVDNGGFGWWLLGCCIPIVGLVLYLVWRDTKPKTAHSLCVGTIFGIIFSILDYVILFGLGVMESLLPYIYM